jgi:von Willebrand factor type A domain
MQRSRWLAAALTGSAAILTVASPLGASARTTAAANPCVVANNVVFVLDDSGSMGGTDPSGFGANGSTTPPLRVQAMQLEIKRDSNNAKNFAAIEFGDTADVLFPPQNVKTNRSSMLGSLSKLQADNGSTDYNLAFDTANTTFPNAQARVFFTDGGHNAGDYLNKHLEGGKPPTYVVGFGSSATLPEDAARLKQIADDTGGQYFAQTSSAKLVSVMNQIDGILNCNSATVVTINNVFTKVNQKKAVGYTIPGGKKATDLVTTFNSGAQFSISNIVETVHGKVIAKYNPTVVSAKKKTKVKKLKVTKQTGATFINLHIRGLKPHAKLKLTLKALKLGLSTDPTNPAGAVTTQITPTTS